jgi:hypothetical protein
LRHRLSNEGRSRGAALASHAVQLCEEILVDVLRFADEKRVPLGINVESVSVRREELDAAVEVFRRLAGVLGR